MNVSAPIIHQKRPRTGSTEVTSFTNPRMMKTIPAMNSKIANTISLIGGVGRGLRVVLSTITELLSVL